jgi:hypothetical protein
MVQATARVLSPYTTRLVSKAQKEPLTNNRPVVNEFLSEDSYMNRTATSPTRIKVREGIKPAPGEQIE